MIRDFLVPGLWLLACLSFAVFVFDAFTGWRPRFGMDAHFQEVIRQAEVAEQFAGSSGRQVDDVSDVVCELVNPDLLRGMSIPVDDRTSWPEMMGGHAKPMDIWRIYQDKGWIPACREGLRHLEIGIDRITLECTAKVKLWHTGCAI